MRKFVKIIVATCTIFFSVANANNGGGVRVKLLFENKEAVVVLSDNPTSNSLLEQLPLELIFVDYASQEKVSRGLKLSMKDAPPRYAPKVGEVIYFAPTGGLALVYEDISSFSGIAPMGEFILGLDEVKNMRGDFKVRIEKFEN